MSFFFYPSGFCGWFHWVQNILSSRVHHVRSWSSTGMIRETLGTLRSDNGDTNENVAEKSGPMKLFPRRYTKSPIYLEVGKLGWSWREGTASELTERWLSPRLAHKSSFWARSASERKLAKACSCPVLPHQTRKPSERLWESLVITLLFPFSSQLKTWSFHVGSKKSNVISFIILGSWEGLTFFSKNNRVIFSDEIDTKTSNLVLII